MRTKSAKLLRTSEAAHELGLHPITVRRWIHDGKIHAVRVGREARIPQTEVERLLGVTDQRSIVVYARVSGTGQRDDLTAQVARLTEWTARERTGREVLTLTDIGSGLKADRKSLLKLMSLVQADHVAEVVVTYADRLTRFGLEYLTLLFEEHHARLTILDPHEEKTPEQELAEDLITLIASFSGRLYGMRSRKQQALLACAQQVLHQTEEARNGEQTSLDV